MSSREPSYRTLRLLCANGAGMVGFLIAYGVSRAFSVSVAAGLIFALIGYVASTILVEYSKG